MIRLLFQFSRPAGRVLLRRTITWIVASAVVQGAAFLALVPFLTALIQADNSTARHWAIVLACAALAYAGSCWVASQAGNAATTEMLGSLLTVLGDRLVELPAGWFSSDRSGQLANTATNGIVFAAAAPYSILRPILTAFLTPGTVVVGALFIDWRMGVAMAATTPVMLVVYRWIRGRQVQADDEHAAAVAAASTRLIEYARAQPALRAAPDNSIAQFLVNDALKDQHHASRRIHLNAGAGVGLFGAVVQLAVMVVLIVGVWLTLGGSLAVATLIPLVVLGVRFAEPVTHASAISASVQMATGALRQLQSLCKEATLPEPETPREPADASISFDRVTFGYGGTPVLRDLSFQARAGQMTAIVGPSGAGKTTITRLIARWYDPESGAVSLGGVPLPQVGTACVTQMVAPVFQDVYLFDGTIVENIWLGRPAATRAEVLAAAARARVDEIAARLPGGWDTRVGEGGTNLSGGERQRISIARALLKDAPIVVLDEATAALDIDNEQAIQRAINELRAHRTVVVVAHRMTTIAAADHIIMLSATGSIAEQGSHPELLAAGGAYARYWNERVEAGGWRLVSG